MHHIEQVFILLEWFVFAWFLPYWISFWLLPSSPFPSRRSPSASPRENGLSWAPVREFCTRKWCRRIMKTWPLSVRISRFCFLCWHLPDMLGWPWSSISGRYSGYFRFPSSISPPSTLSRVYGRLSPHGSIRWQLTKTFSTAFILHSRCCYVAVVHFVLRHTEGWLNKTT